MSLTKKLLLAFLLVTMVPLGTTIAVLHHVLAKHPAIPAPATQLFNQTLIILFATLVGAVGLSFWLARRLADPFLKLAESVRSIAAGRFHSRLVVTARNEIGALADDFNLMAVALEAEIGKCTHAQELLRDANDGFEQRVEERTARLIVEIGERQRAENELHTLHGKHQLVLDAVSEGIHALDLDGKITLENPAAEKMLGWEHGALIGKPAHATMHHSKAGGVAYPQCECPIYASLRDGSTRRIKDEVFWRKDGTSFPVEYVTAPLRDNNREIVGTVVFFSDITERKRAEQELVESKAAAEAGNRAKSEFLDNISHEFRTPMNGVIGMTELLLESDLKPAQREFAKALRASADDLMKILSDILDFSKNGDGKPGLELINFDLLETFASTLDPLSKRADTRGIELVSEMAPDLFTRLRGDPERLQQILTKLVDNALKFTETGGIVVRVFKESESERHIGLHFRVEDTGIGISPEAQEKLFQAFGQVDGSSTRKHGGAGMGLAIAKQFVDLMDGQIGVKSESARGSTFWFTVQLEKQAGDATCPEA
jgi:PAS domain S-box-containing protein